VADGLIVDTNGQDTGDTCHGYMIYAGNGSSPWKQCNRTHKFFRKTRSGFCGKRIHRCMAGRDKAVTIQWERTNLLLKIASCLEETGPVSLMSPWRVRKVRCSNTEMHAPRFVPCLPRPIFEDTTTDNSL